MPKRFLILIEDDFEIQGNGRGNTARLQYLPAIALMNMAEKHGASVTFMADAAHLLALRNEGMGSRHHRLQKTIVDETLLMIKERGFDVQLHLHPQWLACAGSKSVHIGGSWNIGTYSEKDIKYLLKESVDYLHDLMRPFYPGYNVIAFKAGSWGLQPSEIMLQECSNIGIRIILAVSHDIRIPGAVIDYSGLEERYLPYYPRFSDITKVNKVPNNLIVIPLQPYAPDFVSLGKLMIDTLRRKIFDTTFDRYFNMGTDKIVSEVDEPYMDKKIFRPSLRPYYTHLKIGNQPFSYLKASFDSVIRKLRALDAKRIPIVIESHTKQYHGYFNHIDKFIGYISDKYHEDVDFGDFEGFLNEVEARSDLVRCL